jgi:hypothetical protein
MQKDLEFKVSLCKVVWPYFKCKIQTKQLGEQAAQVVEPLPTMNKVLGLIPSILNETKRFILPTIYCISPCGCLLSYKTYKIKLESPISHQTLLFLLYFSQLSNSIYYSRFFAQKAYESSWILFSQLPHWFHQELLLFSLSKSIQNLTTSLQIISLSLTWAIIISQMDYYSSLLSWSLWQSPKSHTIITIT